MAFLSDVSMIASRGFIALLGWSLWMPSLSADEPVAAKPATELRVPPGVVYLPDIEFCTLAEKKALSLDIAYPKEGRGPFPGVICIHGGGWMRSDCKEHVPLCLQLAQAGYVAITVNYRLCPTQRFPYP